MGRDYRRKDEESVVPPCSSNARLSLWLQDRLLDPPVMRMLLQLPVHLPPGGTHGLENQVRTGVMCSQVLCVPSMLVVFLELLTYFQYYLQMNLLKLTV